MSDLPPEIWLLIVEQLADICVTSLCNLSCCNKVFYEFCEQQRHKLFQKVNSADIPLLSLQDYAQLLQPPQLLPQINCDVEEHPNTFRQPVTGLYHLKENIQPDNLFWIHLKPGYDHDQWSYIESKTREVSIFHEDFDCDAIRDSNTELMIAENGPLGFCQLEQDVQQVLYFDFKRRFNSQFSFLYNRNPVYQWLKAQYPDDILLARFEDGKITRYIVTGPIHVYYINNYYKLEYVDSQQQQQLWHDWQQMQLQRIDAMQQQLSYIKEAIQSEPDLFFTRRQRTVSCRLQQMSLYLFDQDNKPKPF